MKIKSQLGLFLGILLFTVTFSACGSAHGGRNCDCPKFGDTKTQQQETIADEPAS